MNRKDLQELAETRLREAEVLRSAGEWSGAYYLAGYAVECAIKACIAKLTGLHDFPDKDRANDSYSHNFKKLLKAAELEKRKEADCKANTTLNDHWAVIALWDEKARYKQWDKTMADDLLTSIIDPTDGVFQWIKLHW